MNIEEVAGVIHALIRECQFHDRSYHYNTTEAVLERAYALLAKLANTQQGLVEPEKDGE